MNDGSNADYIITEPQNEHLIEDTDLKDKCRLERGFGPKDPLSYSILKLYKCQGIDNSYTNFKN